jgi:hypothetical protein
MTMTMAMAMAMTMTMTMTMTKNDVSDGNEGVGRCDYVINRR